MSQGSPRTLRILNDQAALGFLTEMSAVSRADVERATGLSKPAAGELITRLETAGLIERAGVRAGNRGPSAQLWQLRPSAGHAAAANVTPTGLQLRISDLRGTPIVTCQRGLTEDDASGQIESILNAAYEESGLTSADIRHMVIGVPGAVDPRSGVVNNAPHLAGWQGYNLGARIEATVGIPTEVENDVNLMAVSEMLRQAKDFSNFALVWIDEGAGAALVIDGSLFRGFSGGAGEIDHLRMASQRRVGRAEARFGTKWGDLVAPDAIHELAVACGLSSVTSAETLASALEHSDDPGLFFAEFGADIAAGLTAIVTVLDPELIVLSGAYGAVGGERLASEVARQVAELVPSLEKNRTRIVCIPLQPGAALLGAAEVALARARADVFQWGSVVRGPAGAHPMRPATSVGF